MANNIFGGLMKGLSAFIPQDDPEGKLLLLQNEVGELEGRETELYADIGKRVYAQVCTTPQVSDVVVELQDVQRRLGQAKEKLAAAQCEKQEKERLDQEARDRVTCPNCGTVNPDGMKFCQECGSKLGVVTKKTCPKCGADNPPETKFCGECGTRL